MNSCRLVCLFAVLASLLVLAQSSHDQLANQQNGAPTAQQAAPALVPNISMRPQRSPLARDSGRTPGTRKGASLAQGLSFANVVDYGSGAYEPYTVVAADVNGDGKPDMVVANRCGDNNCNAEDTYGLIGVLLGNGDGTFQTAVTYASGGYDVRSVTVADINGDGKPDLVVPNYGGTDRSTDQGTVGVLFGNGDGTFQTAVVYASGGYNPYSVETADVNGDGKPDLVVANACGNDQSCNADGTVGVLLGNGDGTFQSVVTYDSGGIDALSVTLGDVNADGKPDIIVANQWQCVSCGKPGSVGVLLGNGDGTFQTVATYGSGGYNAAAVAVQDVNGDGKPDILVVNFCGADYSCQPGGSVGVLLGDGDGTFQMALTYSSGGGYAFSISVGDVNQDGKPDLLIANSCVSVENNGACLGSGTLGLLLGNGDGTFRTPLTYGSGGYNARAATLGDLNGDGKLDLLASNQCDINDDCSVPGIVGVLLNTTIEATTTTLISSQNPSNYGQGVTFTATVTAQYGGTPAGTVSFFDGGTNIGNSNLNSSGVATLTTSTLSVGTHSITATYNGDANFAPSTSPALYQVVQGAIVTLYPIKLNFGNQTVGIPSSQNVMLTNTGNIDLTIASIQIAGQNANEFSEVTNCPSSLLPNNSCQIKVTFLPTTTGIQNASLRVSDNAPGSPQQVPLTGVGVLPAVTFNPTSLTFSTQVVYTASAPQQVTLTNTGLGILQIKSAKISGQFGVKTDCGEILASGASCTANVKFKPRTKGILNGDISVTDNAPGSPQKVPLTGTGTFVQLTPASLNFGTQPVNTTSVPKYITLVNKGNSTVNFTGTGISITGTNAGDFAEMNNCGTSVPSGGNCRIKVTFTPTQQGKRTADVSISDDGGGSPQLVPLTGTGTP
jgi:hypothetical protein